MAAPFAVARHDAVDGVAALTVVGELNSTSGDILIQCVLETTDLARRLHVTVTGWTSG